MKIIGIDPGLSGAIAVFFSLVIFCMMHWYSLTPLWRDGEVNPYWIVFWPTFLLFSTSLCSASAVALATYGDNRFPESLKLASLSILMTGIALAAMPSPLKSKKTAAKSAAGRSSQGAARH